MGTGSLTVAVHDVAPTIALSGAGSVNEGSFYTLVLGAITDPGTDTVYQWIVNWGDGKTSTYNRAGEVTHVYADGPSTPTITVDLQDQVGTHRAAGSLSLTVENVAPVGSLSVAGPVTYGQATHVFFTGQYDPSPVDTAAGFRYAFAFDPSQLESVILGLAFTGSITLISGWDWYTGSDSAWIGQGQYDFQTIVTHELGHILGLDHSGDVESVMHAYLAEGAVHRAITAQDLVLLGQSQDDGPSALRALPRCGNANTYVIAPAESYLLGSDQKPAPWLRTLPSEQLILSPHRIASSRDLAEGSIGAIHAHERFFRLLPSEAMTSPMERDARRGRDTSFRAVGLTDQPGQRPAWYDLEEDLETILDDVATDIDQQWESLL